MSEDNLKYSYIIVKVGLPSKYEFWSEIKNDWVKKIEEASYYASASSLHLTNTVIPNISKNHNCKIWIHQKFEIEKDLNENDWIIIKFQNKNSLRSNDQFWTGSDWTLDLKKAVEFETYGAAASQLWKTIFPQKLCSEEHSTMLLRKNKYLSFINENDK